MDTKSGVSWTPTTLEDAEFSRLLRLLFAESASEAVHA